MWTQPIFFVYASVLTIFAYRKINRAWVIKSNVCWKRVPKGRASGSKIDPEILLYLTGAINSSIMMLTIAEVTERTRWGQTACCTHFLPTQMRQVSLLSVQFPLLTNFTPAGRCIFSILQRFLHLIQLHITATKFNLFGFILKNADCSLLYCEVFSNSLSLGGRACWQII